MSWARKKHSDSTAAQKGIRRRDSRINDAASDSASNNSGSQQIVNPQSLMVVPTEFFNVGDARMPYAELVNRYDINALKALVTSPSMTVEAHNIDGDGRDLGRISAAEERSFLARMHALRVEEASRTGAYAIPEVRIADRDDSSALKAYSTEDLANELRARGSTVNVTEPQEQQTQVDPAIQQLADALHVSVEQAQQIHAIMQRDQSGQQSQPQSQSQSQSGGNSGSNSSGRGGGVCGGR